MAGTPDDGPPDDGPRGQLGRLATRTADAPRRLQCERCLRPQRACLCAWIRSTDNQVSLLVLQHPLEAAEAKGSARLLRLSLRDCRCEVGERFDAAALAHWLGDGAVLLYPSAAAALAAGSALPTAAAAPSQPAPHLSALTPSALPPSALPLTSLPPPAPRRLVLLDGTWRKTRKMLHLNPLLQQLPRHALSDPPPSLYRIRKAQHPQHRSTLEAACLALGAIEGRPAHYAPLLQAFDGWVRSHGVNPPT